MIKVDRKKFWNGYKTHFVDNRTLTQGEVDGVNYFLDRFENESRLKNTPQHAYVLATAFHESGKPKRIGNKKVMVRFQPVSEGRESSTSPRRANQDRYWRTGFYGRGYPQTTWEENYLKSGQLLGLGDLFVREPDLLMKNDYAYDAMVASMQKGSYRKGKSLDRFLPIEKASIEQYTNARDIINGDIKKNGGTIAKYAKDFENILRDSKLPAAASTERGTLPAVVQSESLPQTAENLSAPAFGEKVGGFMEEAEEIQGKVESSIGEVTETLTKTIADGKEQIQKTVEETKSTFEPQNLPAFIPRFGKQWLLSLIPGAGFASTIYAYIENAPQWLVFLLGAITGIALWKFMELAIKHKEKVADFIAMCYRVTADPAMNNLIPTSATPVIGNTLSTLFSGAKGLRADSLKGFLEK